MASAKRPKRKPRPREEEDEDDDAVETEAAAPSKTAPPRRLVSERTGFAILGGAWVALLFSAASPLGTTRDILRAACGVLAFLGGAIGAADARRSAIGFAVVAGVGLAMVGVGPATLDATTGFLHRLHELVEHRDLGVGLTMLGVLGLGGTIHRLGRLGPA